MYQNQGILKIAKGEREYQFLIDPQAPLGEVFDVLCQMQGYVTDRIKEHMETQKPKEADNGDQH